jgi:hypothetical protein
MIRMEWVESWSDAGVVRDGGAGGVSGIDAGLVARFEDSFASGVAAVGQIPAVKPAEKVGSIGVVVVTQGRCGVGGKAGNFGRGRPGG